jgi:hypothetical protein
MYLYFIDSLSIGYSIRKLLGTEICIAGRASQASEVKRLPVRSGDQWNFSGSSPTRETIKMYIIFFF